MHPLIGITTNRVANPKNPFHTVTLSESYLRAVQAAGGTPVLLPSIAPKETWDVLWERLDGILFTGGDDVDPARFNGLPHPRVGGIDEPRDDFEIAFLQRAVKEDKPFLCICRGIQVMNVALGGTLYTDIADQREGAEKHDWYPDWPRDRRSHTVKVMANSRLAELMQSDEVGVNSLHHQGIWDLAAGLQLTGTAPDGLIEAVEVPGHRFAIGVQWHPEWLQDDAAMRRLFEALMAATA
ncbi:MAG TPA: gamma-glutamyl-gamma-aminobutyrate hydrolase family protein [Anaerolineaceae bacterium]|nr:gamma-glutamyl-gamma-aminobutyrate hydrolase family protein [Anaerolineaceae bacterium]